MRRLGIALVSLGFVGTVALYPLMAGEGSPEVVNNKPPWLGPAALVALACLGIGVVMLIRSERSRS